ncbi:hypothetical protein L210DRAFT_688486 [Boletus edulis BED1]|uniref:Uncharacterized protein n=1 Tax=Boletus edulis BED1 TaxID=1328754 RepID=A0AAD4BZH2_BOLED|nr:hypothetical protein L210DRAFT_688486 [Boletus edulis BED1]
MTAKGQVPGVLPGHSGCVPRLATSPTESNLSDPAHVTTVTWGSAFVPKHGNYLMAFTSDVTATCVRSVNINLTDGRRPLISACSPYCTRARAARPSAASSCYVTFTKFNTTPSPRPVLYQWQVFFYCATITSPRRVYEWPHAQPSSEVEVPGHLGPKSCTFARHAGIATRTAVEWF